MHWTKQTANERQDQKITELTQKLAESNVSTAALRKTLDEMKKTEKSAVSDCSQKDAKLLRAQEELAKLRSSLVKTEQEKKQQSEQLERSIDRLKNEVRRLERHKSELVLGFKKQGMLIDVLRRQKIHLEAAAMLGFTEQEFKGLLDWPNQH